MHENCGFSVAALLMFAAVSHAAPASVRVSFVSPPHSYQHGHDFAPTADSLASASVVTTRAISAPYPPSRRFYNPEPAAATLHQSFTELPQVLTAYHVAQSRDVLEQPEEPQPTEDELQTLIARFASNQPRFFSDFPHQRALLANIQLRSTQNLPELRLGSIRPGSPFLRA